MNDMTDMFVAVIVVVCGIILVLIGLVWTTTTVLDRMILQECVRQGYYNAGQKSFTCIETTKQKHE